MKKMSKLLGLLALTLSVTAVGCGSGAANQTVANTTEESTSNESATADETSEKEKTEATTSDENYHVGIIQLVEHSALDAAYQGFVDGLKELGYEDGKNLTIDYQNAQGDQSNCQTIATKLVNDQNDLILAIATPAAQAVANSTQQ